VPDQAFRCRSAPGSAMFNLAIYKKLRGCDLVRLKVEDMDRMA
jgi:hypothetical protein